MYEKVIFVSCALVMVLGASAFSLVLDGDREGPGPAAAQCAPEPSYYRIGSSSYELVITASDGAAYDLLLPLPQRIDNVSAFSAASAIVKDGNVTQICMQSTEHGLALAIKGSGNVSLRFVGDDFEGMLTLYDEAGKNWMFCNGPEVRLRLSYAHTTTTYMDDGGEYDRQWVSLDTYCYEFQGPMSIGWGTYDIPYDMTED
jgi:hypothetical protein